MLPAVLSAMYSEGLFSWLVGVLVMQIHGVIKQLHLFTGLDMKMPNFFLVARKTSCLEYLNHADYQELLVLPRYLGHQRFTYHLGYLAK